MKIPGRKLAKRALIAVLLAAQLNSTTFYAWADAVSAGSSAAQALGGSIVSPFSSGKAAVTYEDIFPDYSNPRTGELQDAFGSDTQTIELGVNANKRLKEEDSEEGSAYRVLTESRNRETPDMSKDPMFRIADEVRTGGFMQGFKENFADCKKTEVFDKVNKPAHVAKLRTCERVVDLGGNQEFVHDYKVGIVEYVSGQPNYQSCGVGCLQVWVGTVGDNYWGGHCRIYEEYTRFRVINPDAIISATIERATFDDYFQVYFNNTLIWTHTPGVFPPETSGACERSTSWNVNPNTDVTSQFKNAKDVITFKTRTSVSGGGEGYARIRINYDPAKAFKDNGWSPSDRLAMFDQIKDGFCSSSTINCTSSPAIDAAGCIVENGVKVCKSDVKQSPHPSLSPFCRRAQVSADCSFYKGGMDCYTDAKGVERCPVNDGGNLDSCAEYEANPACGFISQRCISGAVGGSGTCYAYEEVWDCGYDTSYETIVHAGTQVDCPGGARCMGSECFDTSNKKSGDFAYAVAMLQVAQFGEHDLQCTGDGTDIEVGNTCRIFTGEAMECKKALGGYVDCCEAPEGVSIFDYVNLTMSSLKMASSVEAISRHGMSGAHFGYWQAAKDAVWEGASTLIKGEWSSVMGNASGAFQDTIAGTVTEGVIGEFQAQLMKKAYDFMVEMGAESAANAVFTQNAAGTGMQLSSQALAVVNFIGMVYTIYVIADLLIKIIWECEEKEFELGAKKETRQCHFVGSYCASKALGSCVEKRESYCCFSSVVARIIQEQGRPQLGMNFGSPESPRCEGLTPDQLAKMDWSRIDLSEWIGMLSMTGNLPTVNTVSLEQTTGGGSSLGDVFGEGDRLNTLERNQQRLDGIDPDEIKKEAERELR